MKSQQIKQEVIDRLKGEDLNNLDWKELYNLCLDLIEKGNIKLTLNQLKDYYEGYFDYDLIKEVKNKEYFLDMCMTEEEYYKEDYSKEELIEVIRSIRGY